MFDFVKFVSKNTGVDINLGLKPGLKIKNEKYKTYEKFLKKF